MQARKILQFRSDLKKLTRSFFESRGYLEIDTPTIVPCGGAEVHLNFFQTQWIDHQNNSHGFDLRTSPELQLKIAMATLGVEKIFELGPCYRNKGELGAWHHPEFTMLEWYEKNQHFEDMMTTTFEYLKYCYSKLHSTHQLAFQLPPTSPMITMSIQECFKDFIGIDLSTADESHPEIFFEKLSKLSNPSFKNTDSFEDLFFKAMIDHIEPKLKKFPLVFLYDYPPSTAALSRKSPNGYAKRFEAYVNGIELCNAFDEICTPEENSLRLIEIQKMRLDAGNSPLTGLNVFTKALESSHNIPKQLCGNALGFDRWMSILLGIKLHDYTKSHSPFQTTE